MSHYSNSQERSLQSVKRNRKKHLLLMFMLLFFASAFAWLIRPYIVGRGAESDDMSTSVTDYHRYTPSPSDYTNRVMTELMPYRMAAHSFTFAQLYAMSNDRLLLVNPDHAVPEYIVGNLVKIAGYVNTLDANMLLNEDALVMLRTMFDSAANVGFTQFRVTQGFRTHEYQQNLYNQLAGTGLAARPGYSEHQVGLAVDISYHDVNIGNSVQGNWLMNDSYKYGFILRYPQHKTHITGVPFEPWHYRYVGQPHAYFMTHNDMVMEEYVDYLRVNRQITVVFDGTVFTVFYLRSEDEVLEISENDQFWVSRDNTGGVIVTVVS